MTNAAGDEDRRLGPSSLGLKPDLVFSMLKNIMFDGVAKTIKPVVGKMFHLLYYNSPDAWPKNQFLGFPIQQCPMDLQLYQEIIYALRPACIIQTGIAYGGSLVYFASLLDMMKAPPETYVVGVDILLTDKARTISHPRVKMIEANSIDPSTIERIKGIVGNRKGLVVLDSDHSEAHVIKEMEVYQVFVEDGSYMVVEDSNLNGHPVARSFGPGPYEAVEQFLKRNSSFLRDDVWKRNIFSFHQNGWLKRIGQTAS